MKYILYLIALIIVLVICWLTILALPYIIGGTIALIIISAILNKIHDSHDKNLERSLAYYYENKVEPAWRLWEANDGKSVSKLIDWVSYEYCIKCNSPENIIQTYYASNQLTDVTDEIRIHFKRIGEILTVAIIQIIDKYDYTYGDTVLILNLLKEKSIELRDAYMRLGIQRLLNRENT